MEGMKRGAEFGPVFRCPVCETILKAAQVNRDMWGICMAHRVKVLIADCDDYRPTYQVNPELLAGLTELDPETRKPMGDA
jgi:hypothetical protein